MARSARRGRQGSQGTRQRITDAALETLKQEGFTGASARAIADRGGFAQALIFYHFGTVNQLLLAALDDTSARRLGAYQAAVERTTTLSELLQTATRLYREDLAAGHITVLNELIGACLAYPELRPEIAARVQPWVDFAEDVIVRALADGPLAELVPSRDAAFATVALYLGVQMLTHLNGDAAAAESLFATGERVAALLTTLQP
ncbi:MAG TPA: TetR/AcrR family transcriptional regulator [Actinomycetes bacterium]